MALINRKKNLTKTTASLTPPPKLSSEEQFWKAVEERSKSLIAGLLEKTLPISATPQNFDLEKDADYRVLLRNDLPASYADSEEYQAKIAHQTWTAADVEQVAEELTVNYFDLVVQSTADRLSKYNGFETTTLVRWKEE